MNHPPNRKRFLVIGRVIRIAALISLCLLATFEAWTLQHVSAQSASGTIAYVRNSNEIRMIEPDGSNDRHLWTEPVSSTISGLAWRPDAAELAFASDHERACSIFESDMYGIRPDGSGLRRITNPPACNALAGYPQGRVRVEVQNPTLDSGFFFVYVQGASGLQALGLPPFGSGTVTFNSVADFGPNKPQFAVVISGLDRWVDAGVAADVQPGQTVDAGTFVLSSEGSRQFGFSAPVWRSDGSQLGFIFGGCGDIEKVPTYAPAGATGTSLLKVNNVFPCVMDWGPTPALANQMLYYADLGEHSIYRATEGSTNQGTLLYSYDTPDVLFGLQWLPDGSGFLFSKSTDYDVNANIYEYKFATNSVTPLTQFTSEFARGFSISPDGKSIVFERAPSLYGSTADVWVMHIDGTQMRLLVQNGLLPVWSLRAPQMPKKVYLPLLKR